MPCVKGNHDEYCSSDTNLEGFNPHAAEAIHWTRQQLTEEDANGSGIEIHPARRQFPDCPRHARRSQRWGYVFDRLAAAASFTIKTPRSVSSAIRTCRSRSSAMRSCEAARTQIQNRAGPEIFINVGSVASARRQSQSGVCHLRYERKLGGTARLDYDIPAAQAKIMAAGLPPRLAERLALGK